MLEIIHLNFMQKICENIPALTWVVESYLDILCQWIISDLEWSLQFSGISSTMTKKQNAQYHSV